MMGVAAVSAARFMTAMTPRPLDTASEIKLTARALAVLRKRADISQAEAAERIGLTAQAWQRYEAGERQAVLRMDLQDRMVRALGFTRDDLLAEKQRLEGGPAQRDTVVRLPTPQAATPDLTMLPIGDRVQAGAWLMVDDHAQVPPKTYPAARDPRFPQAAQWLAPVVGDSVDRLGIYDGDLVHCVDAAAIGYFPRTGDIVEVERLRFGGQERELTLKEVEVEPGRFLLWPRSSNPRWKDPLEFRAGVSDSEEIEVRIRGLVIASIRRFNV